MKKVKLQLKKVEVSELTKAEQLAINGGFLSIGHACSIKNTCSRLLGEGIYNPESLCFVPPHQID